MVVALYVDAVRNRVVDADQYIIIRYSTAFLNITWQNVVFVVSSFCIYRFDNQKVMYENKQSIVMV